jgi:hypothetical protein
MKPRNEVASLALCKRLNARFGPPKNPAWLWTKNLRLRWAVVCWHGTHDPDYAKVEAPAWTLADLLDLARRKKLYAQVTTYRGGSSRAVTSLDTEQVERRDGMNATALAQAILAAEGGGK